MKLYLVRHAQTYANKANRIRGQSEGDGDGQLTEEGERQAYALALRFICVPLDAIYSSDQKRALRTAHSVARQHDKHPLRARELREKHCGSYEGLDHSIIDAEWDYRTFLENGEDGCESGEHMRERFNSFIEHCKSDHPDSEVLAVTHGGLLSLCLEDLLGKDALPHLPWRPKHTSVTSLDFSRNGTVRAERIDCTQHLDYW